MLYLPNLSFPTSHHSSSPPPSIFLTRNLSILSPPSRYSISIGISVRFYSTFHSSSPLFQSPISPFPFCSLCLSLRSITHLPTSLHSHSSRPYSPSFLSPSLYQHHIIIHSQRIYPKNTIKYSLCTYLKIILTK